MGYLSEWAAKNFNSTAEKNIFFAELGEKTLPNSFKELNAENLNASPEELLEVLAK
jgi:hypothetical protein